MPHEKIVSFPDIPGVLQPQIAAGKKVGLITGCFDVLHIGHVELFRQAKQIIDLLVVGLEQDATVRLKGSERPINTLDLRCEMLAELVSVDVVFAVPFVLKSYRASLEVTQLFEDLTRHIAPHYLFTNIVADTHWQDKAARAKRLGIEFVRLNDVRMISSTEIARRLRAEI